MKFLLLKKKLTKNYKLNSDKKKNYINNKFLNKLTNIYNLILQ